MDISGKIIRNYICTDLKKASAYSILADETADAAGKEQLSIGIRFFDHNKQIIREEFVGFVELMTMDAETIADNIKAFIAELDLDPAKCVGLGFDGCATMAGKTSGVQKRLKGTFQKSFFIHCASHRLNLVVNDLNSVPEIRNTISTIKDIINFFKESPIRRKYAPNVHSFCETRWSEKYKSMSDFKFFYCDIIDGLEKLCTEGNAGTRKVAFQLHSAATKSVFLICMCIIAKYYSLLQPVVNLLQAKNNNIIKCREHLNHILNVFEKHRATSEVEFEMIFKQCEKLAENASFNICVPRVVEKQTRRTNPPFTTTEEYYRRAIFIPYLDSLITSISDRFPKENNAAFDLAVLSPMHLKTISLDQLQDQLLRASSFYNLEGIENELELWHIYWNEEKENDIDLIFAYNKTDFYPKIREALEILLAMPSTTATVERSFSTLRRVKTWLRTSMGENRLNGNKIKNKISSYYIYFIFPGLCMLSTHRALVKEKMADLEERILEEFSANPRRLLFS